MALQNDNSINEGGIGSNKNWVKFEEANGETNDSAAVLDTETMPVDVYHERKVSKNNLHATLSPSNLPSLGPNESVITQMPSEVVQNARESSPMHNVPLRDAANGGMQQNNIRTGFANGDVIVTILPHNSSLPWVTPAKFRPELVPEELMAQGLTITVEEYVHVMSQLVNDYRFTLYNMCYKRILVAWITLAFIILLSILFAGFQHAAMFGAGIAWLMINAAAIFLCMWMKLKLNKSLEMCISSINLQLMKHKILLGVDDRGNLSCHKISLCFIYFDPKECIGKLQQLVEAERQSLQRRTNENAEGVNNDSVLDVDEPEIIITGSKNTRIVQHQAIGTKLLSQYSQRWAKEFLRKRLDWCLDASMRLAGLSPPTAPRHLQCARCPCQFIEEHRRVKAERQAATKGPFSCVTECCMDITI